MMKRTKLITAVGAVALAFSTIGIVQAEPEPGAGFKVSGPAVQSSVTLTQAMNANAADTAIWTGRCKGELFELTLIGAALAQLDLNQINSGTDLEGTVVAAGPALAAQTLKCKNQDGSPIAPNTIITNVNGFIKETMQDGSIRVIADGRVMFATPQSP